MPWFLRWKLALTEVRFRCLVGSAIGNGGKRQSEVSVSVANEFLDVFVRFVTLEARGEQSSLYPYRRAKFFLAISQASFKPAQLDVDLVSGESHVLFPVEVAAEADLPEACLLLSREWRLEESAELGDLGREVLQPL